MSSGYSANQYENAFKSQKLQNWCQPKHFKERPSAKLGHTSFIVDDRGHLLPGRKQRDSSWPDFKGTWELPSRIPAPSVCPTARSQQGLKCLTAWGFITPCPDTARTPGGTRRTEGRTEEASTEEGRGSGQQQQEKEEAVQLENTKPTKSPHQDPSPTSAAEREGTPTQKLPATGPHSAVNTPHAEAADEVKICE